MYVCIYIYIYVCVCVCVSVYVCVWCVYMTSEQSTAFLFTKVLTKDTHSLA